MEIRYFLPSSICSPQVPQTSLLEALRSRDLARSRLTCLAAAARIFLFIEPTPISWSLATTLK